jgi:hypothetical protein
MSYPLGSKPDCKNIDFLYCKELKQPPLIEVTIEIIAYIVVLPTLYVRYINKIPNTETKTLNYETVAGTLWGAVAIRPIIVNGDRLMA